MPALVLPYLAVATPRPRYARYGGVRASAATPLAIPHTQRTLSVLRASVFVVNTGTATAADVHMGRLASDRALRSFGFIIPKDNQG